MDNSVSAKKFLSNECNIYILLWLFYFMQGALYESGSIISQVILVVVLSVSVLNCIKVNFQGGLCDYFKGLNLFLAMFTVYGVASMIISPTVSNNHGYIVPSFYYLKNIYISLLPIYSFYYYTINNKIDNQSMKVWMLLFFVVATITYYHELNSRLVRSAVEESTNNSGYTFLSLIPLIVIWKEKPILQYAFLIFVMIMILWAMKRGAILIGALSIVWFMYKSFKSASKWTKIVVLLLSIAIIFISIYAVLYMFENSAYFNTRWQQTKDGDTSNRDILYGSAWNYFWEKATFLQFIFGQGADATLWVMGNYAHNDWFEILIDNGLLGAMIYIVYWILFYREWKSSKYINDEIYIVLGLTLLIYFVITLFSMSFGSMPIFATCGLGYALGCKKIVKIQSL